ncbi:DUF4468 domain-containing protein [Paraflavitalea sp. CAU 1676]|uniref:DUF4468 domain-containing protein n=1 Tax=Paraflavitalea sp. CAU 1676 TaxID=3032598 RepID=UPI0023D9A4A4|nr:DUF4468 domain-containing protein [Paraflavitalea sp. CAU 1676]MDF2188318.1 DUF4468 domain-containing protein [Paraflavitalea sp. CAU 1676]
MKCLLFCLLFPFITAAQNKDSVVTYTGVVNIESVKKEELYIRARQWFNRSFKDSRSIIRVSDKETGEILAKGVVQSYHWYKAFGKESKIPISYNFDISIYLKEGKYKYEFTNFIEKEDPASFKYSGPLLVTNEYPTKGYRSKDIMDKIWISQREELNTTMSQIVVGLNDFMEKSTSDF